MEEAMKRTFQLEIANRAAIKHQQGYMALEKFWLSSAPLKVSCFPYILSREAFFTQINL